MLLSQHTKEDAQEAVFGKTKWSGPRIHTVGYHKANTSPNHCITTNRSHLWESRKRSIEAASRSAFWHFEDLAQNVLMKIFIM